MKKNYEIKDYKFSELDKKLIIPSFQRNIEWENTKQKLFIKNVLDGNPFGCILVSKKNKKYFLVDGLQRISTLRLYKKNKYDFLDEDDLDEELLLQALISSNKKIKIKETNEDTRKKLEKLKKEFFKILASGENLNQIYNKDKNDFILVNDEETNNCLKEVKRKFSNYTNISILKIPTIIYSGDDISSVFVNLNTTALNLTKYETFAASWHTDLYKINDDEIKNKIKERYNNLKSYGFDVEKTEEVLDEGVTLFEYCYALGEILGEKYPYIFEKSSRTTNPCGFEILALICDLQLGKEVEIDKYLNDAPADFLISLKNEICNSIDFIQSILKKWIIAKNLKINISDRTYNIYHIIMCYIKLVYNIQIDFHNKKYSIIKKHNVSEELNKFKKYLPYHYFLDNISGFWDLNRQVSDLKRLIDTDYSRYFSKPNYLDVEKAFKDYKDNSKDVYNQTVTFKNKLIIDYLFKLYLDTKSPEFKEKINELFSEERLKDSNKTIDFEHIISKKKFEHIFNEKIKEICKKQKVYSLGNLCYLDSKSNRAKGGLTIYEFDEKFKDDYNIFLGGVEKDYIDAIYYPSKDDLEFVNERIDDFISGYNDFIESREKHILKDLKELINLKLNNKKK